jgi:hypothetical protein
LPRYWDIAIDALVQDWRLERVWCNPPFSFPAPFLWKATTAHLAVVLLRGDCLTTHYAHAWPAPWMAMPTGRLSFDPPPGFAGQPGPAPWGVVLLLYGAVTASHLDLLRQARFQVWKNVT